jgi:methionyl aminopeptidase
MFTLGSHEVRVRPDGWTVETRDGSLAAHWEHSIAVTADGPRILTVNSLLAEDERPLVQLAAAS